MLGELVQTTAGNWIPTRRRDAPTVTPSTPAKYSWDIRRVMGHGGGHTTWTCRTCDQTVYGPPLNTHCTALEGPATVWISNVT